MRDLKDLKKEEEAPGSKKAQPVLIIGLLSLLVFLALFLFFRGGKSKPAPEPPAPTTAIIPTPKAPPQEGGEEPPIKDPALKPGEMKFEVKKEETVPPPATASAPPSQSGGSAPPALKPGTGDVSQKEDLTFYKSLKGKNSGENKVALKPKKESKSKESRAAKTTTAQGASRAAGGAYTIQVASYTEREGAESLAKKLRQKGYASYIAVADLPEKGKRYRVRVGHFPSRREAEATADKLHGAEKLNFFIATDTK